MTISSFLNRLSRAAESSRISTRRRGRRQTCDARFEQLEPRELLATFTWNTDSSGNWSDPANWTGGPIGAVPGNGDSVIIDRGAANPTITFNDNVTLASFVTTENFVHQGIKLKANSIDINGGTFRWLGGNLESANTNVAVGARLTTETTQGKFFAGHMRNSGTIEWQQPVAIGGLAGNATFFTNQPDGTWTVQQTFSTGSSILFTNEGLFRKTTANPTTFTSFDRFDHRAGSRIEVAEGTLQLGKSGLITLPSTGAEIDVAAGAVLNLNQGSAYLLGSYTGTGAGRVEITQGDIRSQDNAGGTGTTFDFAPGLLHWTGGTIIGEGLGGDRFTNIGSMTWSGTGSRSLQAQEFHNTGTIIQTDSGSTLFNGGGTGTNFWNDAGGVFDNRGTGPIIGGKFQNSGIVRNTLNDHEYRTFFNHLNGSRFEVSSGRVVLNSGGDFSTTTLDITGAGILELAKLGNTAFRVVNGGTVTGTGGGRVEYTSGSLGTSGGIGVLNFADGMFQWLGGTITNEFRNTGFITIPTGSTGSLNSGTLRNERVVRQQSGTNLPIFTVFNEATGLWILQNDASITGFNNLLTNAFYNSGTLRKTGSGSSTISGTGGTLSHRGGTVDIQAGNLSARHSNSAVGTGGNFVVAAGCVFEITDTFSSTGSYTGSGGGKIVSPAAFNGRDTTFELNFPNGMFEITTPVALQHVGAIRNSGFLSINNPSEQVRLQTGNFANYGVITQTNGTEVLLRNGANVRNFGTWILQGTARQKLDSFDGLSAYLQNFGTIRKTGNGVSSISGGGNAAAISNTGTIDVRGGTLEIHAGNLKQFDGANSTLHDGTWRVGTNSTLSLFNTDLTNPAITTSYANIILDGPGSNFTNIANLQTIGGNLTLSGGRTLTTAGSLTNGVNRSSSTLTDFLFLDSSALVGLAVGNGILVTHPRNQRVNGQPVFNVRDKVTHELIRTIVQPGSSTAVAGIDLTTAPTAVGGVSVPAGTLLFINAQVAPATLYAIDVTTGNVLASQTLAGVATNQVGVAFHPVRNTVFLMGQNEIITEVNPANGSTLNTFNVRPSGSTFFSISTFGGLDVNAAGNLLLAADAQKRVRELTPTGVFVSDTDLTYSGMAMENITDIAIDDSTGKFMIASGNGATFVFDPTHTGTKGDITIAPDSRLIVNGTYSQTGTTRFQIGGSPETQQFGTMTTVGPATLNGTISFDLVNGFAPSPGNFFNLMSYPSQTGSVSFAGALNAFVPEVTPTVLRVTTQGSQADLAVQTITVPANGIAGSPVTIQYTVRNLASGPTLVDSWTDSVYLSLDGKLDASDQLIGRVAHSGIVAAGATYSGTLTAPLPGGLPRNYRVFVVADSRGDSPDSNRNNNIRLANSLLQLTVPALTPGVAFNGNISEGEEFYLRVNLTTSRTPQILTTLAQAGVAEVFVSQGEFPTRTDHDHYAFSADEKLLLVTQPAGRFGTFYILVRGTAAAGAGTNFSIVATDSAFGLSRTTTTQGANSGKVSTRITGAGFTSATQFELLRASNGDVTTPFSVQVIDPQNAWVTFDLTGKPLGDYNLRATDGANTDTLNAAFKVIAGTVGKLEFSLDAPSYTRRPFRATDIVIEYRNTGDTDVLAPIFQLNVGQGSYLLPGQTTYSSGPVQFIGANQNGPADVLPPGAVQTIRIPFLPDQLVPDLNDTSLNFVNISLQVVGIPDEPRNPGDPEINWEELRSELKPATTNQAAWNAIFDNFKAAIGTTFESYQRRMAANAAYLASIGQATLDIPGLIAWELQKAGNFGQIEANYYNGVLGQTPFPMLESRAIVVPDKTVTLTFGNEIRGFYFSGGVYRPAGANGTGIVTVDSSGNVTLQEADGIQMVYRGTDGRLASITSPRTGTTTIGFDAQNRPNSVTDPNGDRTAFLYNSNNKITRITDAVGRIFTYTYNANGQVSSITTPLGTTTYSYVTGQSASTEGALRAVTSTDGTIVRFFYNDAGLVTRVDKVSTSNTRITTNITYDEQLTATYTDGAGQTITVKRGLGASEAIVIDALGQTTTFAVKPDGRIDSVTDPDGSLTRIDYGSDFLIDTIVDAAGNTTGLDYINADGTIRLGRITDPTGSSTEYDYDISGNLSQVLYADNSTRSFEYDSVGNKTAETNPAGDRIVYVYNSKNLLVRQRYPDGSAVTYTYDARRNLTSASRRNPANAILGTTSWTYDSADRLTSVSYENGTSLAFTYDAANRRSTTTDHAGNVVRYTYDAFGRLFEVFSNTGSGESLVVRYAYDTLGRKQSETRGNGAVTFYLYDALSRVTRITHSDASATVLERFTYTYDARNQVVRKTSLAGTTNYEYDAAGQLTRVTLPGGRSIRYTYDADGNRTQVNDAGTITNYTSNGADQYLSIGSVTPTYDDNNSLTSDGTVSYQYDINGRLTQITNGIRTIQYEYDGVGNRIASIENGVRTNLLNDPAGLSTLFGEYTTGTSSIYANGNGIAAKISATTANYYHYDLTGNTALLTGNSSTVTDKWDYLPFGEQVSRTGSTANPFTFNGKFGVSQNGIGDQYYMRNRNYSATLGRFLETDPIETVSGETNLYRFVKNAPVAFVDPSGLLFEGVGSVVIPGAGELGLVVERGGAAYSSFIEGATYQTARGVLAANAQVAVAEAAPGVLPGFGWTAGQFIKGAATQTVAGGVSTAAAVGWYSGRAIDNVTDRLAPESKNNFRDALYRLPIGRGPEDNDLPIYGNGGISDARFQDFVRKSMQDPLVSAVAKRLIRDAGYNPQDAIVRANQLVRNNNYPKKEKKTEVIRPSDPNNIIGPAGAASEPLTDPDVQRTRFEGFVQPTGTYSYEIHFENKPAATAPAQTVTVTHVIDSDLDLSTFQLISFGWGDTVINVPTGRSNYFERVDESLTLGVLVDVEVSLNPTTRTLTVTYTSLDPNTLDYPIDPFAGFLPPNLTAPQGDGFVQFSIAPNANLTDGTQIQGEATIVFDFEDPISTPLITNTIDISPPTSRVRALSQSSGKSFTVSWTSSDGTGSGVAAHDIYVSKDGGPFTVWLADTTARSATFDGQPGSRYSFYSIARDGVGLQEAPPSAADTFTHIAIALLTPASTTEDPTPTFTWDVVPNAVAYQLWVSNLGTGEGPIINVNVTNPRYTPATPLGIGNYAVWIRSRNANGTFSNWGPRYSVLINTAVQIDSVERYQRTATPTISWQPVAGADHYDVWIDNRTSGQKQYVREMNLTNTSWTPSADMPIGAYRVWVRAIDSANVAGRWSAFQDFVIQAPPQILSPATGTFNRSPVFSFSPVAGATHYEFLLHDRNGATVAHNTNLTTTSFVLPNALPDGFYQWWVHGVSASGIRTFWSPAQGLYIGGRPTLLSPEGTTTNRPVFSWGAVDGAVRYDLWVNQLGGNAQILRRQNLTSTSFTAPTALAKGTYRVWIRAISSSGEVSPWSIPVDFTIAQESSGLELRGEGLFDVSFASLPLIGISAFAANNDEVRHPAEPEQDVDSGTYPTPGNDEDEQPRVTQIRPADDAWTEIFLRGEANPVRTDSADVASIDQLMAVWSEECNLLNPGV